MNYQKSIRFVVSAFASCVLLISLVPQSGIAQNQIVVLEHPDALLTQVFGINDNDTAVGSYTTSDYRSHGFLWVAGQFTATIDVPGALDTFAYGINNLGDVAGNYFDSNFRSHGFVVSKGTFTTIDYPDARHTQAFYTNNRGQVFGAYDDQDGAWQGFIYDGGRFTRISVPGAYNTFIYGGNDKGEFSGAYNAPNGPSSATYYGLLGNSAGLTTFSYGAAAGLGQISNNGTAVGNYTDGYVVHGVILRNGAVTVYDVPGANWTSLTGVNNDGWLAGMYTDASSQQHSFIRIPD